jgi:hypothetical protein
MEDPDALDCFRTLAGVRVVSLRQSGIGRTLVALRRERFDRILVFWTGDRRYRRLKLAALLLGRRATLVDNGDGGQFRLRAADVARHLRFRRQSPLPRDYWVLDAPPPDPAETRSGVSRHRGDRVLVIESAEPSTVLRGLEHLGGTRLFQNPRYTLFCRNRPEGLARLGAHPALAEVRIHDESRGALGHLVELRRERFDALVLFWTGDPSYWKIKFFAFLLGARHRLIFNENDDCFFFSWSRWLGLVSHRLGERSRLGSGGTPRWAAQSGLFLFLLLKVALVPVRFAWLLLVWLRLRVLG